MTARWQYRRWMAYKYRCLIVYGLYSYAEGLYHQYLVGI